MHPHNETKCLEFAEDINHAAVWISAIAFPGASPVPLEAI